MLKKTLTVGLVVLLFSFLQSAFAGAIAAPVTNGFPMYLQVSGGYSFSMESKLRGIDPPCWDAAIEGYNAALDNVPSFGAGLGYHANPWLNILLSSTFRGAYHYKKFQTPLENISSFNKLPAKTRYFDLDNTNVMLSFIVNGDKVNSMHMNLSNGTVISPFIGVGAGVARNDVYNFHSVLSTSTGGFADVHSTMDSKRTYSLAAEGLAGLSWLASDRASFDLGYRFYYGGRFKSNDYLLDLPNGAGAVPWEGDLLANEVFLNFRYDL